MTRTEFLQWAEGAGVDPRTYRLGSTAESDVYVLERSSGGWAVFYSERGNRNSEAWYPAEGQALDELQRRLDHDPTTRRQRHASQQEWVEAVPPVALAEGEAAFEQWLREKGLRRSQFAAEEIRLDVGRWQRGSFARYAVRRDALRRLGIL